jgi:hypothetical protein
VYFKINNNTGQTRQVYTEPADNCTFCMENGMIIITQGTAFQALGILTSSSQGSFVSGRTSYIRILV